MAESIKLPARISGSPETQLHQLYSYLYRMAQTLNVNLKEIGSSVLTKDEQDLMNSITQSLQEPGEQPAPAYNYAEAETLKSLIIKTAQFVKNEVDNYRLVLFGDESAEGSQGNWKRKKGLRVDVTPDGVQQTYSYAEIVQGLKTFEINAKNYIKTGYLRTENAVPIYGVAIGKDVVTFSEDGTETYNDGNKVAELTAGALTFYQGGNPVAKYTGSNIIFYYNGSERIVINSDGVTFKNGSTKLAEMLSTALKFYYNGTLRSQMDSNGISFYNGSTKLADIKSGEIVFYQNGNTAVKYTSSRIGFYNNGTEYMYISGGKIFTNGDMEIGSGHNIKLNDWALDLWGLCQTYYSSELGSNAKTFFGKFGAILSSTIPAVGIETGFHTEQAGSYTIEYGNLQFLTKFANSKFIRLNIYGDDSEIYITAQKGTHGAGVGELPAKGNIGSPGDLWDIYADYVYYNHLSQFSSRNVKHNIQPLPDRGAEIDALEPVTFVYNNDAEERQRAGLIYEDTIGIMPEICTGEGNNKAINYVELIPYLLKEIQDLRKRVKALEDKEDR